MSPLSEGIYIRSHCFVSKLYRLTILAGLPTATQYGGMFSTTVEPAPIIELSPTFTPRSITAFEPIQTFFPMTTGLVSTPCLRKSFEISWKIWDSPPIKQFWAHMEFSPIVTGPITMLPIPILAPSFRITSPCHVQTTQDVSISDFLAIKSLCRLRWELRGMTSSLADRLIEDGNSRSI